MVVYEMLVVIALSVGAVPPKAPTEGPFAYHMAKTPEEGPVDPAVADRYTKAWRACSTGTAATPDLVDCFRSEFARQDAALNHAWPRTLHRVPASRRRALIEAQRRWIAARDPFCKAYVDGLRGSLVSTAYLDCRVELTIRRTIWMETL